MTGEELAAFADGVWLARERVRMVGMRLTSTMAVVRLGDGGLLVYSPIALTPARRACVEPLGPVRHLYAPNLFHHKWLGEWMEAFPEARVHAPAALARKRPGLRIDRAHDQEPPEPAFAGVVDELHVEGCRLEETALLCRPARTLLVADLVHNIGRPAHGWTAFYSRAMGFHDRVALSRVIRWSAFSDRAAARRSLDKLLALPFDRVVVGHGEPITAVAPAAVANAYRWLRA